MISVILPFLIKKDNNNNFNNELNSFKISIGSIVNQTFKEWELIIVDDGSNLNEIDSLIESFKLSDNRIKYHKNGVNKGIVKTLNESIINYCSPTSKYIARMDADDISHPKRLENQIKYMESNSEIDILGCPIKMFNDEKLNQILEEKNLAKINSMDTIDQLLSVINREEEKEIFKFIQFPDKDLANWSMFFNCCLVHPSVLFKRSIFDTFKYQDTYPFIEDYDLWLNCIVNGNLKCSNIQSNTPLLFLRKHGNSVSSKNIVKQRESTAQASTFYLEKLFEKNGIKTSSSNASLDSEVVRFLISPVKYIAENNDTLSEDTFEKSIEYLEAIESSFLNQENQKYSTNIKDATNERIGEIASLCLSKFPNNQKSEAMWKKWISRNPTSQLLSLLSNLKTNETNNNNTNKTSDSNASLLNFLSNSSTNNKPTINSNNNKFKDNGIKIICFSKDRAFQLREHIRTFFKYLSETDSSFKIEFSVLYTYSNLKFKSSYQAVEKEFPNVKFIKEENFTEQLIQEAQKSNTMEFTLFSVDDILYFHQFNISNYCKILKKETSSLGFYMKMTSNITYCHTADEEITIPLSLSELSYEETGGEKYLKWNRSESDCKRDWNYPFDLCSTIYKTSDVDSILNGIVKYYGIRNGINHPNRLEFNGNRAIIQKQCYQNKPYCLCPTTPIMSVVTINRVQDVYDNPIYDQTLSLEDLDILLQQNDQLDDLEYYNNSKSYKSVHIGNLYVLKK
ncbi:hypothetical protein DICPUDRAFT_159362 [Dictyostelium purpureum]|uniref:Glycosyltransferase 2-like domain-containing protein n=1 Tax=Dictyostelium purpureum TaxID=5786 RepID=F1A3X7_DICPU|nr:uncharacterized protein DICPUDRAFT_159362 [Dictyostelium purpureum]EGC29105.1 hypothetical protein DICPUDRAFT_159362 [Dictyostelium purpureum]|eukprot:XP_003294371.1 hypothetical protein DICPUDRAFT_159362 [Dictyostelium purpureum]